MVKSKKQIQTQINFLERVKSKAKKPEAKKNIQAGIDRLTKELKGAK